MTLIPTDTQQIARGRADLRMGLPVVIRDGAGGLLVAAAETVDEARFAAIQALGGPPAIAAITAWRAQTLKARAYDGDLARVVLPEGAGVGWLRCLADPARDLDAPLKGPLKTLREGDPTAHRMALLLAKSAQLLPTVLAKPVGDAAALAARTDLICLTADMVADDIAQHHPLSPVAAARLPMEAAEAGKLHIFRPENGGIEHYAIEIGRPDRATPVLARLHSACFTGDVLGSLKCDCGPQLRTALAEMGRAGGGVLLYLNQEGRGIGLTNKMRAYSLQDQGFDTVEANHRLGFEDDERDFRIGADLLRKLGFSSVRLMTNNPRKVAMMEAEGIAVTERVPLITGTNRHNAHYLAVKARKSGHLL